MTDFTDVGDFHRKFDLHTSDGDAGEVPVPKELVEFRLKFLKEELQEFEEGAEVWDHAQMFDALIDLVYVALGTAHLFGYPWDNGWRMVQEANMAKVRSTGDADPLSKRGSSFDVVKPPGWKPPDIASLLLSYGFKLPTATTNCPGCGKSFEDSGTTCGPRPALQGPPGTTWCSLKGDWVSAPPA